MDIFVKYLIYLRWNCRRTSSRYWMIVVKNFGGIIELCDKVGSFRDE